jgi:hypothetical protein
VFDALRTERLDMKRHCNVTAMALRIVEPQVA